MIKQRFYARGTLVWLWCAMMTVPMAHAQTTAPRVADWQAIVNAARGQTVYFHAWGGSSAINDYIAWAADEAAKTYGITVRHVKVTDIAASIAALKIDARQQEASADVLWVNGENFRNLKSQELLYGAFVAELSNNQYLDYANKPLDKDFTEPTLGLEAPWGAAQLVFLYDRARMENPPQSAAELAAFVRANPHRFTYPKPPEFHGTTFIKQLLLDVVADRAPLYEALASDAAFDTITAPLWAYLDGIHPHLWREGRAFPASIGALHQMLARNQVALSMTFNPFEAQHLAADNKLPDTVRTYAWPTGTIGNIHFLTISKWSSASAAAKVWIDFLLSPIAQARKANPAIWGDPTVLDIGALPPSDAARFERIAYGAQVARELPITLPEIHATWVDALETAWQVRYGQ